MIQFRRSLLLVTIVLVGSTIVMPTTPCLRARADSAKSQNQPEPVEKSMHEFMEYFFQPTYKRLHQSMAGEPADNNAWKRIKADALILAEGGNLLLLRAPKEDAEDWGAHSSAVREQAGGVYASARKKDYQSARQHYEVMLKKCNACHDQFAKGEHQLSP